MKKILVGSFLGAFGLVAAACSVNPSTSTDDTATADDALKVKHCGGFVAHPQTCPAGYECIANHIPDIPGTCKKKACIQNVICAISEHFDSTKCKCVPNMCIQNVLCTTTSHYDHTLCECVPNAT